MDVHNNCEDAFNNQFRGEEQNLLLKAMTQEVNQFLCSMKGPKIERRASIFECLKSLPSTPRNKPPGSLKRKTMTLKTNDMEQCKNIAQANNDKYH